MFSNLPLLRFDLWGISKYFSLCLLYFGNGLPLFSQFPEVAPPKFPGNLKPPGGGGGSGGFGGLGNKFNELNKQKNQGIKDLGKDLNKEKKHLEEVANNEADKARKKFEQAKKEAMASLKPLKLDDLKGLVIENLLNNAKPQLIKTGSEVNANSGTMNLKNSEAGKTISHWLSGFAQGNSRSSGLDELSYNVNQRRLSVNLWVRHRHNYGRILPTQPPVDLYDVTQRAKLIFDFKDRSISYDIDCGPLSPKISSRTLQNITDGDLISAAESMSPGIAGKLMNYERVNQYYETRAKYYFKSGPSNIYFASKSFVDWATPETLARYFANGVLTAGASVWPQIMADSRKKAREELPQIVEFLQKKGLENAETIAEELLTGGTPRWPFLKFEITKVSYKSREKPLNAAATPWREVDHLAFVITWVPNKDNGNGGDRKPDNLANELRNNLKNLIIPGGLNNQNGGRNDLNGEGGGNGDGNDKPDGDQENGTPSDRIYNASELGIKFILIRLAKGGIGCKLVEDAKPGTPAGDENVLYEKGDIITKINGKAVKSAREILDCAGKTKIQIIDIRNGKFTDFFVDIPGTNNEGEGETEKENFARNFGIRYILINLKDGSKGAKLLADAGPGTPAGDENVLLEKGDIIVEIDGNPISSNKDILNCTGKTRIKIIDIRTNRFSRFTLDLP